MATVILKKRIQPFGSRNQVHLDNSALEFKKREFNCPFKIA